MAAMEKSVSHDRQEETIEAKARWFQSLTLEERMELFVQWTDFIMSVDPTIVERKDAQPIPGRVQVLSLKPPAGSEPAGG